MKQGPPGNVTDNNGLEVVVKVKELLSVQNLLIFSILLKHAEILVTLVNRTVYCFTQGVHANKEAGRDLEHALMISLNFSVIIQPYPKSRPLSLFMSYGTSINKESRSPILFSA